LGRQRYDRLGRFGAARGEDLTSQSVCIRASRSKAQSQRLEERDNRHYEDHVFGLHCARYRVSALSANLSPAATTFLRTGASRALADCDLEQHRCHGSKLTVLETFDGEHDDVSRHAEKLSGNGILLDVIFELPAKPIRRHTFLIERLELRSSRWPLGAPFRIGSSPESVLDALGGPASRTDECWRYSDEPDDVTLCLRNRRLATVTWSFFVD